MALRATGNNEKAGRRHGQRISARPIRQSGRPAGSKEWRRSVAPSAIRTSISRRMASVSSALIPVEAAEAQKASEPGNLPRKLL